MKKLLTIIIPIYNVDQYLEKCIESVIRQTYSNLEIILVDDGSADESKEICDKYAREDARIKVIHKQNGGLVSARKAGLEEARGYYTVFVDGDDWIDLDMYECLISELETSEAEVVTSGFYKECGESSSIVYDCMDEGIYFKQTGSLTQNMIYRDNLTGNGITTSIWNKLFITEKMKKYYMTIDNDICYGEDAACVYAYLPQAESVRVVHRAFYHYRFRSDSIVHVANDSILQQVGLLYKHLLKSFHGNKNFKELKRQLSIFTTLNTLRGLNYYIGFEDDVKIPLYMVPNKAYTLGTKIVLYGAGMVGQAYEKQLRLSDEAELVIWVDKMASHYREQGKKVSDVRDILNSTYDLVLIAVSDEDMVSSVKSELMNIGVPEDKLYWEVPKTIIEQFVRL